MNFDALTLAAIADELQPLVGGKIQRISQPDELQIVLSIFKSGIGEKHLLLDCSVRFYRAHLTKTRVANPPVPSPFCMTLRKYLSGARIISISQRNGDRILDIRAAQSEQESLLCAELMGKHANIILVAPDNKILHAAKLITSRQSRLREISPGREYSPPPAPNFAAKPEAKKSDINSAALDEHYSLEVPRARQENEKKTLLGALQKTLRQKQVALEQVRRGTKESTRAAEYRRWGELILGNLHVVKTQIERGAREAEVLDFYDEAGTTIKIPLDENLSAAENAERYFGRARHVEDNAATLRNREEELAREVEGLQKFLAQLECVKIIEAQGTVPDLLNPLREEATTLGWLRSATEKTHYGVSRQNAPNFDGHKIKTFSSPDGFEILVGENATANDYLVTRLSHSNDWWLHLRNGTSSHAIIKTHNAPDHVPMSTLVFAARLVVARSVAKHAGWAEVAYTLRKHVRKPRKAAPGAVTFSHDKTLRVEPQS